MSTEQGPLFPFRDPIAGDLPVTPRWRTWFLRLRQSVDLSSLAVKSVRLQGQNAAVAITSLDGGTLSAGLYAVSWYMTVVVAAGVSSSAQVTVAWVDHGVAKSYTAAGMTGNTLATVQGDQRVVLYSDAASPITFAVAYSSNSAGAMLYDLRIVLQSVAVSV